MSEVKYDGEWCVEVEDVELPAHECCPSERVAAANLCGCRGSRA